MYAAMYALPSEVEVAVVMMRMRARKRGSNVVRQREVGAELGMGWRHGQGVRVCAWRYRQQQQQAVR